MDVITIDFDSNVLKNAKEHLRLATQERSYYRSAIEASKQVLKATFTVDGHLQVQPIGSCLPYVFLDIEMHFSLDVAQQVGCMQLNLANKLTQTCKSVILSSLVRCTSLHHTNVPYLGCIVKRFQGRWVVYIRYHHYSRLTTSLMKQLILKRVLITSLACFIIFWKYTT